MVSLRRNRSYDRPPRSLARKLLVAFNVLLAMVLLVGVAGFGYFGWRWEQIARVDIPGLTDGPGNAMNVLMVGSDSRAELAEGEEEAYGTTADAAGQRADTIMILHVDPGKTKASILSIPRDTWVTNSLTGRKSRINESFDQGPNGLIETIQDNFGINIQHYAEVNFDGFKGVVDAVGGVNVLFSAPARDTKAGLNVPEAGCVALTGDQALAYARSRYYQANIDGRWVSDPRSDLSRIDRQQDFIRRVIAKAVSSAKNPITLNSIVGNAVPHVTLDEEFGVGDITKVAARFRSLDASQVEMMTIPTTGTTINGASVLEINDDEIDTVVDRFLNGPPEAEEVPNISPSSISIRVLNGSGVGGQASEVQASLQDAGFVVTGTGNSQNSKRAATIISYAAGEEDKAQNIQKYLGGDVEIREDTTITGVDAIVTTGTSFSGVVDPTAPTTAPPTTEAPASTTTTESPFLPTGTC